MEIKGQVFHPSSVQADQAKLVPGVREVIQIERGVAVVADGFGRPNGGVTHDEITFARGRVQQRNFHDYPMLRMHEMPVIETHIVESNEKMGGVGEPGVPSLAPAVGNAIFAASGKRVRRLPIRAGGLQEVSA